MAAWLPRMSGATSVVTEVGTEQETETLMVDDGPEESDEEDAGGEEVDCDRNWNP